MKSIRWKILIPTLVVMVLSLSAMILVITMRNRKTIREQTLENAQFALAMVYQKVETFDRDLTYTEEELENNARQRLLELTEVGYGVLQGAHNRFLRGEISLAQAQAQAKNAFRSMGYGDDGYFWIDNADYILQVMPPNPASEGSYRGDLKDTKGTKMVRQLVDGAVRHGSTFVNYWFPKPGETESSEKLGCSRYFEPWGWVLGTGVYIDHIDEELARLRGKFLEDLNVSLFETTFMGSYPFIKDRNATYIAYINQDLVGTSNVSRDTVTGESLDEIYFQSDGKMVEYNYTRPGYGDKSFKKLAFIRIYEPLDWIIAYSLYEDDILAQEKEIRNIILFAGVIFLVILSLSVVFVVRQVTRRLKETADILQDISEGEGI